MTRAPTDFDEYTHYGENNPPVGQGEKPMTQSPFQHFKVEGSKVKSAFWQLEAKDEQNARRIAEVIQSAYERGRADKVREVREALLGSEGRA